MNAKLMTTTMVVAMWATGCGGPSPNGAYDDSVTSAEEDAAPDAAPIESRLALRQGSPVREADVVLSETACPCVDTSMTATPSCSMGVEWHCPVGWVRNPSTILACEAIGGGCWPSGASNGAWCCAK